MPDLSVLTQRLGVDIDPELLVLALTHRSYAYEHPGTAHNERLEFLGDSILGQAVTVMLYRRFPDLDEGDLARRRASLVSTLALAEVARGLGIGAFIRLGRGEQLTGGADKSSILADTVEAIIGACFLANGPDVARDFVLRLVETLMDDPDRFGVAMDPKTTLQELAVARGAGDVVYRVESRGPDHARVFTATVLLGDEPYGTGEGSSKKAAESLAALAAIGALRAAAVVVE
ncbi:MAG: ribonuclease III [Microbacteriaceae bacterium]|nr:ribonuclease III [Microbacteriaceae bacterium]